MQKSSDQLFCLHSPFHKAAKAGHCIQAGSGLTMLFLVSGACAQGQAQVDGCVEAGEGAQGEPGQV